MDDAPEGFAFDPEESNTHPAASGLTWDDVDEAARILQTDDRAVLRLLDAELHDRTPPHGEDTRATALVDVAKLLATFTNVNLFRVLERWPDQHSVDVDGLDESFIERFDGEFEDAKTSDFGTGTNG